MPKLSAVIYRFILNSIRLKVGKYAYLNNLGLSKYLFLLQGLTAIMVHAKVKRFRNEVEDRMDLSRLGWLGLLGL